MVPLPKSGNFVIFLFFSKSVFSKNECQMQLVLGVWAFSEDSSSFLWLYIAGTSEIRQLKGLPLNTGNRASSKSCGGRVSLRPAHPRDIGLHAFLSPSVARTRTALLPRQRMKTLQPKPLNLKSVPRFEADSCVTLNPKP